MTTKTDFQLESDTAEPQQIAELSAMWLQRIAQASLHSMLDADSLGSALDVEIARRFLDRLIDRCRSNVSAAMLAERAPWPGTLTVALVGHDPRYSDSQQRLLRFLAFDLAAPREWSLHS